MLHDAAHGIQYWPVFAGSELAGCCGLKPHEPERHFYEIGFHFRPEFWGSGYVLA